MIIAILCLYTGDDQECVSYLQRVADIYIYIYIYIYIFTNYILYSYIIIVLYSGRSYMFYFI